MATDSFTTGSDTVLSTYDANWAQGGGYTNTATVYQATDVVGNTSGYQNVCYYYSASSSDDCQIVKKALSDGSRAVNRHLATIRTNASRMGYRLYCTATAGTVDNFVVLKETTVMGGGSISSTFADTTDYTMRIQATAGTNGQEIRVWINSTQLTFGYASNNATREDSNYACVDLTSNPVNAVAPYTDGSPGFMNSSSAALADTYWDDFDDLAAAAGDPEGHLIGGKLINGGLLLGGVLV